MEEAAAAELKALSRKFPGGAEENYNNLWE